MTSADDAAISDRPQTLTSQDRNIFGSIYSLIFYIFFCNTLLSIIIIICSIFASISLPIMHRQHATLRRGNNQHL
ncbi:GL21560 [Drosophila persimilis]|uniref:GL21560 n=1 Tax=Drosophila persimilis TaxID=7234 RepID=B4GFU0_DROPE|nr:GL21560 [Drosophila persimilis]